MSCAPKPTPARSKMKTAAESDEDWQKRIEEVLASCAETSARAEAAIRASEKACEEAQALHRQIAEIHSADQKTRVALLSQFEHSVLS